VIDESLKDQFCVVTYDGSPFPGIIVDVDDSEVEVNVMHRIGDNRFFWPMRDDVLWYSMDNVITLIPPVSAVTKRHHEISKPVWLAIKTRLGIE
jgi:hypothetical protein